MEGIKPEAVRISCGTELYTSQEEAIKPFVSPSDQATFEAHMVSLSPVESQMYARFRMAAMLSVPGYVRFSGNAYRWIRETTE